jgi:hypothetical protein
MPTLPAELLPLIVEFAPLFSKPVWEHAKTLLAGAMLAVGNSVGLFGGSVGSVGKLVKGIDGDKRMSLDEGDSC